MPLLRLVSEPPKAIHHLGKPALGIYHLGEKVYDGRPDDGYTEWVLDRVNMFPYQFESGGTLTTVGTWKRAARTGTVATRMISFKMYTAAPETEFLPNTTYRVSFKARRSAAMGTVAISVRPNVTSSTDAITIAPSVTFSTTATTYTYTFTTGAVALGANAGIALVSNSGQGVAGDYIEIETDSVIVTVAADTGPAFNGATVVADPLLQQVAWVAGAYASQSVYLTRESNAPENPGGSSTITNKSLTSNVATITTAAPHGFLPTDQVVIVGVDATFNGTYIVTSTPTPSAFTYARTAANVAATSATGTATAGATGDGNVIIKKQLTSNVATIMTAGPHRLTTGTQIVIAGVDATFNGTYTITSVPAPTTFTYAKTATNVAATTATGTVDLYEPPVSGLYLFENWNGSTGETPPLNSTLTSTYLKARWPRQSTAWTLDKTTIVNEDGQRALRILYPRGTKVLSNGNYEGVGPSQSGATWRMFFPECIEATCEYDVKFEAGYDWTEGGKLPGLTGGVSPTGGSDDPRGFSCRWMWNDGGKIIPYAYWWDQPGKWGSTFSKTVGYVTAGQWFHLKQRIRMNTKGSANGILQIWLDNATTPVVNLSNIEWRKNTSDGDFLIDAFYWSTFHGGSGAPYAPDHNQYIFFRNITITRKTT